MLSDMADQPTVMWFRRDLRLSDNPALAAAVHDGPVCALFVLDDALRRPSGAARIAFLYRTLRALDADLRERGGRLVVRHGKPEAVVPTLAREIGASAVHVSEDFMPYGRARDEQVAAALGDIPLVRTGSPYAVSPGRVTKDDGSPYRVYTPFFRVWKQHGWPAPQASAAGRASWVTDPDGVDVPADPHLTGDPDLPEAGEAAARAAWQKFRRTALADYADTRNEPGVEGTSRMSAYLKYGSMHPRTLLADLGPADETYRQELAWRDFYATIAHFYPDSLREYYQPQLASMAYDTGKTADAHFEAWASGRTGYPVVDAGMRQLLETGWMHNRVRMITASFLVKDLHIEWMQGARHFMKHLVDGDVASNNHGWQWVAGSGTDASPFFRVFNPVGQGQKFDPDGAYVRRWIPELSGVQGKSAHAPWELPDGVPDGYPDRIVDHAEERLVALERYQAVKK